MFSVNINKQLRLKIDLISFKILLKCSVSSVVSLKGKAKAAKVFSLTWESGLLNILTLSFTECFGHGYSISYYNACLLLGISNAKPNECLFGAYCSAANGVNIHRRNHRAIRQHTLCMSSF